MDDDSGDEAIWATLGARVDLAFPEAKVAIEYEGAYHFEDGQIVRDDARYARLRAAGWTVIRLTAANLLDLSSIVARLQAHLSR